jgi:hypothetical protein
MVSLPQALSPPRLLSIFPASTVRSVEAATMSLAPVCYMTTDVRDKMHALSRILVASGAGCLLKMSTSSRLNEP